MKFPPQEAKRLLQESEGLAFIKNKWVAVDPEKLNSGKLLNPDLIAPVKPGETFKATLREYQQKGLNWMLFLHSLRFGACLADDMGLGKTSVRDMVWNTESMHIWQGSLPRELSLNFL